MKMVLALQLLAWIAVPGLNLSLQWCLQLARMTLLVEPLTTTVALVVVAASGLGSSLAAVPGLSLLLQRFPHLARMVLVVELLDGNYLSWLVLWAHSW